MNWPRAFQVSWSIGGLYADGAAVFVQNWTRIAMSTDTLPLTSMFKICWHGSLAGIQVGLTDARSIQDYMDSQMDPAWTQRRSFACGLRLRSELPAAWPRWTFGSLPVGSRLALDVSNLILHHRHGGIFGVTYHELNVRLRWSHSDYVLTLNDMPAESIRLGPRDGLPYLRGHSRLVLEFFGLEENVFPLVQVRPMEIVTNRHLLPGRQFPMPCERCLPDRDHPVIALCSCCNAGYCANHGRRCVECDLQVCVGCEGAHLHVI